MQSISGVELQIDYVNNLKNIGISCFNDIDNVKENSIDTCFSFHVLEHLLDPIETLHKINNKLVENGIVIIEVPHANDFLLSVAKIDTFKKFTLWSQHLVLHTRDSLKRFLEVGGFCDIIIKEFSVINI